MMEDAFSDVDEKIERDINPKLCKKWLNIIILKLFETQSALSRHIFKLSKRLKDPMFERSSKICPALKKHILEQNEKQSLGERGIKRLKPEYNTEKNIEHRPLSKSSRRRHSALLTSLMARRLKRSHLPRREVRRPRKRLRSHRPRR
jgi:hypothetical protein